MGLAACVVLGLFGWLTATRGGADEAGRAEGRAALVTAPVEQRVLESLQVTRGTVVSPSQATVRAPSPAEGELAMVVTGLPLARGAEVGAGATVVELNGRPVLALPGTIPLFRDIRPGTAGPDVGAVHGALQTMGYEIAPREREQSVFGWSTREAVATLYERAGYEPRYTLGSEDAVEQAWSQADAAVTAAETALSAALASGLSDVTAERRAVDEALANRDRVRASEGVLLPAQEVVAVPALPAVLVDLRVAVGRRLEPDAPVATIGSSRFQVRIDLTEAQVNELTPDVEIAVLSDGYEATCPAGDVRRAEERAAAPRSESPEGAGQEGEPGGDAAPPAASHVMTVTCDPPPQAEALGANLRVTMTVRRAEGPVLVVPATAITTTSSGEAYVEVVGEDAAARRVAVSVGGEADGFVAVEPAAGEGSLVEGMEVRVRRN